MRVTDELANYCDDIMSGKIIAGQKHKWACLRFLNDLEKQGTEEFPWVFNPQIEKEDFYTGEIINFKPADRYFEWMQLFKHRKGSLAGKQKIPDIYEKFVYGNIYGWVHMKTGLRRFRRSYEQVGRKNAKSQDKAIQSLYEISAFGEPSAEAYVAATKKEQTRHVWGEADWLYKNSILKDKFVTKFDQELMQTAIRHKLSGSFFMRMSKEDKKTGDGSNPQFMVLDEYHLQETTEYYDLGTSGMKTRLQPLLSIITTAGFDLNNPCYRVEYKYVAQILDPENPVINDRYFAIICELDRDETGELIDDIKDFKIWIKSNPIIAKTETGMESLKIDLAEALDKPEKKRDFLTKSMNVWIAAKEGGYMSLQKWNNCGTDKIPDLSKKECYVGIDLSSKLDLTSVGFSFPLGNEEFVVLSHSFMPEDRLREKIKTDKIPFDIWVKQGWITLTKGEVVDYRYIQKYIQETEEKNDWIIKEIDFDPYNATQFANQIADEGYEIIEIRQGVKTLSEPTKNFRELVYQKKIIHDKNPVLAWAIGNAVVRKDHNNNIMLDKSKSTQRIDPIAATLNAHVRAMINEPTNRSVYEDRGIRTL